MGQCPAKSPFWNFFIAMNSKELLSNDPYVSYIGLSFIKLLGTELIISHTFQCKRYFSFACPGKFDKYHKGDFVGQLHLNKFQSCNTCIVVLDLGTLTV